MATRVYRDADNIILVLPDETIITISNVDFEFSINSTNGEVKLIDTLTPATFKEKGSNIQDKSGLEVGSLGQIEFYLNIITGAGVSSQTAKGITSEFLNPRGAVGTAGWGDIGFIVDTPVVLLTRNVTERIVYPFFAKAKFLFNSIDPQVAFLIYSTGAPVLTTGDVVTLRLEARYFKAGDDQAKVPDETLPIQNVQLTFTSANTLQGVVLFTLDKDLIATGDVMQFTLARLGGDAADNYNSDVGIGLSGIILESKVFNP